jgi:hypothetical protein
MKGERARNSSVVLVSSFVLGVSLLVPLILFSNSIVSNSWVPAENTRPNSLVCDLQGLNFSKEVTISNITGGIFLLLTIQNIDNSTLKVYLENPTEEIQDVGFITWKDGAMYAITTGVIQNGRYVIDKGHIEQFNSFQKNEAYSFMVIEKMHPINELEALMIQYSSVVGILLVIFFTCAFSLIILPILVPLFEESNRSQQHREEE